MPQGLLGDGGAEQGEYLPGGDVQTRQRERQRRTAEDRRFKRWADGGKLAGVFVIVAWIMRDRLLLPEYTAACQVQMDLHRVGYWWILCLVGALFYATPMVGIGLVDRWRRWRLR